jgi:hypothetical protein
MSCCRSEFVPGAPSGYGNPEYPFVNLIKVAPGGWNYGNASLNYGVFTPDQLDVNGYPLYDSTNFSDLSGASFSPVFVPLQYERPGNDVLTWTGAGALGANEPGGGGNANFTYVGCTGQGSTAGGFEALCSNLSCSNFTGYTTPSPPTLVEVTPPTGPGTCGTLVPGQPISADPATPIAVSSGTYNQSTGAVSSVTASAHGIAVGQTFSVVGLAGTGEVSLLNGNYTAVAGTSGTTLNFVGPAGLGAITITASGKGSGIAPVQISPFGTPTIITGAGIAGGTGSCPSPGTNTCYPINFGQTVGNSGSPATLFPGGRLEYSVADENYLNGIESAASVGISSTGSGTSGDQLNTFQTLGLYYSCLNTGSCSGADDETTYWTGQIAGTLFLSTLANMKIGSVRNLGWEDVVISNATTWSTRRSVMYASWASSSDLRDSLWAGSTGAVSTATVATFTGQLGAPSAGYMTVTCPCTGTITPGLFLDGNAGVTAKTMIQAGNNVTCLDCTGTGGAGIYLLENNNQTQAPESMSVTGYRYKVSFSGSPPQDKDTVIVGFNATSPAIGSTVYFSADGGTTYHIMATPSGSPFWFNTTQLPQNNDIISLVYDADLQEWMTWKSTGAVGIYNEFVPPEANLEIINEISEAIGARVNPWITISYMESWPLTDYTTQYATLVKTKYPSMRPIFETPNEIWNNATGYNETPYTFTKSVAAAALDPQILTTSQSSSQGTQQLFFSSIPSYVKVGAGVADLTTNVLGSSASVQSINRASSPQTVTLAAPINNNVGSGDQIGFAWSSFVNNNDADGTLNQDGAGFIASIMCQAVYAVYGGDMTRYECGTGLKTNGEGADPTSANSRILSLAFMGQNLSNIPLQTGCIGATAIQTGCPTFVQAASYNYLNKVVEFNYWNVAECDCSLSYDSSLNNPSPQEIADGYNFFNGSSGAQSTIAASYVATYLNPWVQDTPASFSAIVYPATYNWATTCAGATGSCPITGIIFYEGSQSVLMVPATSCGGCDEAGDRSVSVSSATPSGSVCSLGTTRTITAEINDGSNNPNPGIFLSPSTQTNLPIGASITSGASAGTKIIGYENSVNEQFGFVLNNSQYVPASTSMTIAANGAVAGMHVTITAATGGSWPSVVGGTYTVQSSGLSASQIPIDLDCSGLGGLSSMTLTYTGSVNYVNFLRNLQYFSPESEVATDYMCQVAGSYGGGGCSQLDIATPISIGAAWSLASPNIYAYNPAAACSACTTTNTPSPTLTLGSLTVSITGTPSYNSTTGMVTVTLGTSSNLPQGYPNPACEACAINQPFPVTSGIVNVSGITGTGSVASLNVDTWAYVNGSTMTYNIAPGLTLAATANTGGVGQIGGRFQAGQTIVGNNLPPSTAAPAISITACTPVGGAVGPCGTNVGDTLALSSNPGTITAQSIFGTVHSLLSAAAGFGDYNATRSN